MGRAIDRRSFLRLVGWSAGGAAVGGCMAPRPGESVVEPATTTPVAGPAQALDPAEPPRRAADVAHRVLVVIELSGGNDGLSMLVPYADPAYARRRPTQAVAAADVHAVDDEVGWHPRLAGVAGRAAAVEGVGADQPDLSHAAMAARWWTGDSDGTSHPTTGFLGRLCDQLDVGAPATGVALGVGSSPALQAAKASTIGLPDSSPPWFLVTDDGADDRARALRRGLERSSGRRHAPGTESLGAPPSGPLRERIGGARAGLAAMIDVVDALAARPERTGPEPENDLGWQLDLATQILRADVGVRVIHVRMNADFDTHAGHASSYDHLMGELDTGLRTFTSGLDALGLADRVLVATVSEFGRRLAESGNGLDHGTASTALLLGPVHPGRYGAPPSLTRLDDDGNLVATTTMADYYATIAEAWFGIPARDVVPGRHQALSGVIA